MESSAALKLIVVVALCAGHVRCVGATGSAAWSKPTSSQQAPPGYVTLPRGSAQRFALAVKATEVTQQEWEAVMGHHPSRVQGCAQCPVESISWYDAIEYTNRLSRLEGLAPCYHVQGCSGQVGRDYACAQVAWPKGADCLGYRLPTEVEWLRAARAGGHRILYGELAQIAWLKDNSPQPQAHQVAQKAPNASGLYDVIGNVWEWLWDASPATASRGAAAWRAGRGCSWQLEASSCGPDAQFFSSPGFRSADLGLRPVRSMP